jgi:hypothetical protein
MHQPPGSRTSHAPSSDARQIAHRAPGDGEPGSLPSALAGGRGVSVDDSRCGGSR